MTKFDAARAEQLARELREDDERMTRGPWRRGDVERQHVFGDPYGNYMAYGLGRVILRMNEHFPHEDDAAGIARLRNNAGGAAAQLDAAAEEIGIWERRAKAAITACSVVEVQYEEARRQIAKRDAAL